MEEMHLERQGVEKLGQGDMWCGAPESPTTDLTPASHLQVFNNVETL